MLLPWLSAGIFEPPHLDEGEGVSFYEFAITPSSVSGHTLVNDDSFEYRDASSGGIVYRQRAGRQE